MYWSFLTSLYGQCLSSPWLIELGHAMEVAGLPGALFLVGLVGGFTHCAGMCGPFVLAQVAGDSAGVIRCDFGEWGRLRGAALLPYHLGRLTTYAALGALFGGMGELAVGLSGYRELLALFLSGAALAFLLQGLLRVGGLRLPSLRRGSVARTGHLARMTRPLFAAPRGWRGYGLGLALGFLPCAFLYGALAAAAGSGGAARGALAMAAFALGTVPNLILVGYVGVFFGRRAAGLAHALASPLMLVNAGFLGFLAFRALG